MRKSWLKLLSGSAVSAACGTGAAGLSTGDGVASAMENERRPVEVIGKALDLRRRK